MPVRPAARLLPALLVFAVAGASAQSSRTLPDDDWCDDALSGTWSGDERGRAVACEVREVVLQTDRLSVQSQNGGVTVRPWGRPDVLVRARVASRARSQSEAERNVRATRFEVNRGAVRAATPRNARGTYVVVDYEVFAPAPTALSLKTTNGGLRAEGMSGPFDGVTVNGGIALEAMTGDVTARTTNGGITARVGRSAAAHDLKTTNGGITVEVADGLSADLLASTRVGRIATSGLALRNEVRERGRYVGDELVATLGRGGPRLSAQTTNGGISIRGGR